MSFTILNGRPIFQPLSRLLPPVTYGTPLKTNDCVALSCQVTQKLKLATTLE